MHEVGVVERLGDHHRGAVEWIARPSNRIGIAGDDEDRHRCASRARVSADGESIGMGQVEVGDQGIGDRTAGQPRERRGAVGGDLGSVPIPLEQMSEQARASCVGVDDENQGSIVATRLNHNVECSLQTVCRAACDVE